MSGDKTNRSVVYRGLYTFWQRVRVHKSFPKHFFVLFLHVERRDLRKFLRGNSDAYNELICIMQHVHFQVRVGVLNCQQILTKICFLVFFAEMLQQLFLFFLLTKTCIDWRYYSSTTDNLLDFYTKLSSIYRNKPIVTYHALMKS